MIRRIAVAAFLVCSVAHGAPSGLDIGVQIKCANVHQNTSTLSFPVCTTTAGVTTLPAAGPVNAVQLQGNPVSATAPTNGYVLTWGGASWAPAANAGVPTTRLINTTLPITVNGGSSADLSADVLLECPTCIAQGNGNTLTTTVNLYDNPTPLASMVAWYNSNGGSNYVKIGASGVTTSAVAPAGNHSGNVGTSSHKYATANIDAITGETITANTQFVGSGAGLSTIPITAFNSNIVGQSTRTIGSATAITAGTTVYLTVGGTVSATVVPIGIVTEATATLQRLYCAVQTAPGGADTEVFLLRLSHTNGAWADQTTTCTITGAAKSCNDTAHTVAAAAGDQWAIKATASATATTTVAICALAETN